MSSRAAASHRLAHASILMLLLRYAAAFRASPARAIVRRHPSRCFAPSTTSLPRSSGRISPRCMSAAPQSHDDLASMKVSELREILRANGLAVSGIKAQLVERLVEAGVDVAPVASENNSKDVHTANDIVDMVHGEVDALDNGEDELAGLVDELKNTKKEEASDARKSIWNINLQSNNDPLDYDEDDDLPGLVDELKNVDGGGGGSTETTPMTSRRKAAPELDLLDAEEDDDLTGLLDQLKGMDDGKSTKKRAAAMDRDRAASPGNLIFAQEDDEDDDEWYDVDDDEFDDDDEDEADDEIVDPNQTAYVPEYEVMGKQAGRAERGEDRTTFKEDFQGTRVFVQGLPEEATWKDLKDHFKIAGEVVFASVSIDKRTGRSKQCGIVQYETPKEAQAAIREMRNHPLNGATLYVRKDVQETRQSPAKSKGRNDDWFEDDSRHKKEQPPDEWKRANDKDEDGGGDDWYNLRDDELKDINDLIQKRDRQRRQRNYQMSDRLRDQLKEEFGVHLDDRFKLWWTDTKHGGVPSLVSEMKGEGRWGKQKPWRQIPTNPENDAMVDADEVMTLLSKRDRARMRKDFDTADALLQRAHDAPRGGLKMRIHDESRTWRIWTEKAPPPRRHEAPVGYQKLSPEDMCLRIVEENEPDKLDEMRALLRKFPGRALNIFKKLKDRYEVDG